MPREEKVRVCDKAKETRPIFPGASRYLDWAFDDPATGEGTEAERLEVIRRVRDEIKQRVREFVDKDA